MEYPEWINDAEKLYKENKSFTEIGRILNVNRKLVSYYLQKKGYLPNHKFLPKTKVIQKSKKNVDESTFEKIDSEEKAYWLGMLMSDGTIGERSNRIELALKEEDFEHIHKFKSFMKSEHKIGKKIKNNKYVSYRLGFNSEKIKNDLINLGCTPQKTKKLKFPDMKKEFIRHFIRGYLDGDGHISKESSQKTSIEILGYEDFLEDMSNHLGVEGHIYGFKHSDVKRFIISGKKAREILDFLYKDSNIYLERKYKRYLYHCRLRTKLQKS